MIFLQTQNQDGNPPDFLNQIEPDHFFKFTSDFLSKKNRIRYKLILKKNGSIFYADIIASMMQNLFETNFLTEETIENALLTCAQLMTDERRKCKLIGLLVRPEAERYGKKVVAHSEKIYMFRKIDLDASRRPRYDKASIVKKLSDLLPEDSISEDSYSIFFVAGAQNIRMVEQRVKKAGLLIKSMIKEQCFLKNNFSVILSGGNNARSNTTKVGISNESRTMRNLLIHKINDDAFPFESIVEEMGSADTSQNVRNIKQIIRDIVANHLKKKEVFRYNFFVISSTFHLLQLHGLINKQNLLGEFQKREVNVFYVGAENPLYRFITADAQYMKYLFQKVVEQKL